MAPKILKAFALAPLVPAVVIAVANGWSGGGWAAIPLGILIYSPFAYGLVLLFGLMAWIGLRAWKCQSCLAYSGAGTVAGAVAALVLPVFMLGRPAGVGREMVPLLLLFSACGGLTGAVFWHVAYGHGAGVDD